ncbi:MAG: MICOS complex subunit MIC60 [Candidatus Thalassarchaeum betae]|nr:MICOS complex subunit MIC60 [Candidatus Thalassoarchaea betae]
MASESDLKEDWKRVDRGLLPEKLLGEMPQPECKGLTLLTDVIINATVCHLGPAQGQVTARYEDDIEFVLDVAETIRRRCRLIPGGFIANPYTPPPSPERHLCVWVRSAETGGRMNLCIVGNEHGFPAVDDCISFVLWAESGFQRGGLPGAIRAAIRSVRDPELYEREQSEERQARQEKMRIEKERRYLVIEQRLARCQAQQELELQRKRVRNLGWRELMAEHESASPPEDDISSALYHLRDSLLTLPAPGHPIGQH